MSTTANSEVGLEESSDAIRMDTRYIMPHLRLYLRQAKNYQSQDERLGSDSAG